MLADDHRILAEGLRGLLEPEFEVVGVVADGRELVAAAKKHRPDVIVADVTMPSLNGIDAAAQLRDVGVTAKVVFLTMHHDVAYARRAMEAGAAGFVLKHSAATELVTAVREALRGQTYVTPLIAGELLQSYRDRRCPAARPPHRLTARQREVLQLFAEGRSAKEVAAVLKSPPGPRRPTRLAFWKPSGSGPRRSWSSTPSATASSPCEETPCNARRLCEDALRNAQCQCRSFALRVLSLISHHILSDPEGGMPSGGSAISRHKRLLGSALRGRSEPSRERECHLRVLTRNLMILVITR